ncbi:MAG TPA: 30S ribosomal protein S17 [Blastocatellia bacterium]|nr:30S ribosomal protein S17 [Blastocatellia bacterium]
MFRRKKTEEQSEAPPPIEANESAPIAEPTASTSEAVAAEPAASAGADTEAVAETAAVGQSAPAATDKISRTRRGNRVQKVGTVSSDKMQKTVVVRVDRLVLHRKYRRYVRRTSKFMAHDDLGSTTGDRVRIVETRPLSASKRWRVVEIVQKAAK